MAQQVRPLARRLLLGPLILIGLGVLLLLTNLGVLPWDLWRTLLQFWPVLLVLLGLELLLTGRASWGAALIAFLVLLVVAVIVGGVGWFPWADRLPRAAPGEGVPLQQAYQDATVAEIRLSYGAGRLELGAGAGQDMLVDGEVQGVEAGNLSKRYRVTNGVGALDLELRAPRVTHWLFRRGDTPPGLALRLTDEIPIRRLEVNAGAVDGYLDLAGLQVQRFDLDTGASSAHVRLPASGEVSASINAGASSLVVEVPPGVAARIRVEGGAVGFDVDQQRFPQLGPGEGVGGLATRREYRSPDFDQAANRVDLQISAGAASVEVR